MTARTRILYVNTDRGHDVHGDGSHQRPFATEARAISEDPQAIRFVDDVYNPEPRQLDDLGEDADVKREYFGSWGITLAAIVAAFLVGAVTHDGLAAILAAAVVVWGALAIGRGQR